MLRFGDRWFASWQKLAVLLNDCWILWAPTEEDQCSGLAVAGFSPDTNYNAETLTNNRWLFHNLKRSKCRSFDNCWIGGVLAPKRTTHGAHDKIDPKCLRPGNRIASISFCFFLSPKSLRGVINSSLTRPNEGGSWHHWDTQETTMPRC